MLAILSSGAWIGFDVLAMWDPGSSSSQSNSPSQQIYQPHFPTQNPVDQEDQSFQQSPQPHSPAQNTDPSTPAGSPFQPYTQAFSSAQEEEDGASQAFSTGITPAQRPHTPTAPASRRGSFTCLSQGSVASPSNHMPIVHWPSVGESPTTSQQMIPNPASQQYSDSQGEVYVPDTPLSQQGQKRLQHRAPSGHKIAETPPPHESTE